LEKYSYDRKLSPTNGTPEDLKKLIDIIYGENINGENDISGRLKAIDKVEAEIKAARKKIYERINFEEEGMRIDSLLNIVGAGKQK
jgi:hypothetical protein